jgi:glutamine synthetase adenylyltransferase
MRSKLCCERTMPDHPRVIGLTKLGSQELNYGST